MKTVFETLKEYCGTDAYPFHMPGHKRNALLIDEMYGGSPVSPYDIDITEIDGMDNLHHAEGILMDAQNRAAAIYGAEKSFFLINGSTCGLLASVFACTEQGGAILMARNCHKAVYHAAELRELQKFYLYPEEMSLEKEKRDLKIPLHLNGRILPSSVEEALRQHPEVSAVLITSPTYDGMVSDVKAIAEIVHRYGKALIVDEAHGAHYGFTDSGFFPENSLQLGADLVVHSLHKTLPSLTQTALLSVRKMGKKQQDETADVDNHRFVDINKVRKYLGMFETSSPSYIMMAGMDQCLTYVSQNKERLFGQLQALLEDFYTFSETLSHVHVIRKEYQDLSKILIYADDLGGYELADLLRSKYHLEVEMAAPGYVLALTTIFDTSSGFERLKRALHEIDNLHEIDSLRTNLTDNGIDLQKDSEILEEHEDSADSEKTAFSEEMKVTSLEISSAAGYVSDEYVYLYPPGIPLVVPGEVITSEIADEMIRVRELGFELQGMEDYSGKYIRVKRVTFTVREQ